MTHPPPFADLLGRLAAGQSLGFLEAQRAVDLVMQGAVPDGQVALFLLALREKGETVEEIAGAAAALRAHMTPVPTRRAGLVDTCGTGGDGARTFNISTAAALVAAAAGVPVAKHGNRSITSRTGSADVLEALGVRIDLDVPRVSACLDDLGIGFCFAPLLHPAMKRVAAVRKELAVPTIFNLLGPLANPASAPFQLLGVGKPALRPVLAAALARLGVNRAVVVTGDDGLDEVTLAAPTGVTLIEGSTQSELRWAPADFGLPVASLESLLVDGPQQSASLIRAVLAGELGPPRDIVLLNAAAALWTARHAPTLADCAASAARAVDSGAAQDLLQKWIAKTASTRSP